MARLSYTMPLYIAGEVTEYTPAMTCADISTTRGVLPQNAYSDSGCKSCADPMNILFLNVTPASLESAFKGIDNHETGEPWETPSWFFVTTARDQRAKIGGSCKKQTKQLVAGWFWDRFHVRLWTLGGNNVIASAHHENLLTIGGNPPLPQPHKPDSFESGKVAICDDFQGLRNVIRNGLWLGNSKVTPYCSGYAAVIG